MPRTKAFPKNTEIEMILTFTTDVAGGRGGAGGPQQGPPPIGDAGAGGRGAGGGGRGGGLFSGSVASVTPTADSVTMREHVSLVELPQHFKLRIMIRARNGGDHFLDTASRSASRFRSATSVVIVSRKRIRTQRSASL